MRTWTRRHVALMWMLWTALLVLGVIAVFATRLVLIRENVFFSVNVSGARSTLVGIGMLALLAVYLPPIVATAIWLRQRTAQ